MFNAATNHYRPHSNHLFTPMPNAFAGRARLARRFVHSFPLISKTGWDI